ncbi:hypothetical protein KOR42_12420 [Thalassoglobus neptunius]|uniref:Uncharacterized protein n=1 Tax=Thalassoglobus neptunius TaxID=1938619 RepID=A0A5C5X6V3_9PLAN|nr:hypothetical protein KOR42_12420 [Thalassoglobus neptunius]
MKLDSLPTVFTTIPDKLITKNPFNLQISLQHHEASDVVTRRNVAQNLQKTFVEYIVRQTSSPEET